VSADVVPSFADSFWPNFWSSLLSSALLAVLLYFLIERRLHLRDRDARQAERLAEQQERRDASERDRAQRHEDVLAAERAHRWDVAQSVLRSIEDELEHNREQAELFSKHLPLGELPYPAFDVNGWHLILRTEVVTAIQERTLRRLVRVYNRFQSANSYHTTVNDVMFGATAVLAVASISGITDETLRALHERQLDGHRAAVMARLLDRTTELLPLLDEALEVVRGELEAPPDDELPE
jgi:hypothetical protein